MVRVKTGFVRHRKHKKILEQAKGYFGRRSRTVRRAKEAVLRAGQDAYIGRKLKKRSLRQLWIQRINGALSGHNISYSKFTGLLKEKRIELNRKMLAELASQDQETFGKVVKKATKKND